jgi:outer membrane protein OmpA-like peptidoglycan-associated protein
MSPRRLPLLATLLAALPAVAGAQSLSFGNVYVGGGIGLSTLSDADVTMSLPGDTRSSRSGRVSFDDGFSASLHVGYDFRNGFRAELEGIYRRNDATSFTGLGLPDSAVTTTGGPFSYGLMVNGYYDIPFGWPVDPYVGLGLGAVMTNWDNVRQSLRADPGAYTHVVGTNLVPAYQLILGVGVPIGAVVPGLAVTFEYRFYGQLEGDRDAYRYVPGSSRLVGSATTGAVTEQSLTLGLRYYLSRPTPPEVPPIPAAAPAPARSFLVFFDFDRADLTDRARQILADAASAWLRGTSTRVELAGHADRAGLPRYNQRLSERRAEVVAGELERRGVPRSSMTVEAFGEARPLVPTADGAREPQNRRVEIVLR